MLSYFFKVLGYQNLRVSFIVYGGVWKTLNAVCVHVVFNLSSSSLIYITYPRTNKGYFEQIQIFTENQK